MITAKDLMTTGVITVKKETPVRDLVKLMAEKELEAVPVIDDNENLVGIVTDGDLVVKASKFYTPLFMQLLDGIIYLEHPKAMESELKKMLGNTAGDIMTSRVITVTEDTPLEEIATTMVSRKVKRLPVVKDKKVVGIITRKDIISTLAKNDMN